jgi:hypothetical protein
VVFSEHRATTSQEETICGVRSTLSHRTSPTKTSFLWEVNFVIHLCLLRVLVTLIRAPLLIHFTFVIAIVLEVIYLAITLLLVLLSISCWCT